MANYINDEFIKQLDDAQWEAEYGDDRVRLLQEEEDNGSVGEQGHDACFPKADVWTVWVNRVQVNGFLVHFYDANEAYDFATAFLYHNKEDTEDAEIFCNRESHRVHDMLKSHNVLYVGKTTQAQTAIYRGASPPTEVKILSKNKFYKIKPSYALNLGTTGEPKECMPGGPLAKIPISIYDTRDWKSYLTTGTAIKIQV